jgi:hypothetical protein
MTCVSECNAAGSSCGQSQLLACCPDKSKLVSVVSESQKTHRKSSRLPIVMRRAEPDDPRLQRLTRFGSQCETMDHKRFARGAVFRGCLAVPCAGTISGGRRFCQEHGEFAGLADSASWAEPDRLFAEDREARARTGSSRPARVVRRRRLPKGS